MTSFKLILRNVQKNIRDYLIYFLTLTLSVSLFYAFNSISDQPAFSDMGMTGSLLYDQLGILLSALSVVIAVVLAFLIIYANQFLLKRRKKELGVYMMLGMKKGRISRLFAGETICVGIIALVSGLILGFLFSQGLSLVALKLFAIELDKFQIVFSAGAFRQTVLCFAIIFFIVMLFNVWSVTNVKLIDLLTASRKNESMKAENRVLPICLFVLSLICIGISVVLFNKNGILPSRDNMSFQIAGTALVVGTFLLFNSLSTVFIQAVRASKGFYLKGLNTFLVRQIGSKIRTNYLVVTIVCGLLTITICAVSIGASTALAMNELSKAATPYDLNVLSNVSIDGNNDIAAYLATQDVIMSDYAENMEQISIYEADMTYAELFEGQDVELWPIDEGTPVHQDSVRHGLYVDRRGAEMNMRKLSINKACVLLGTLLLLAVGAVCAAVYLLTQNITAVRCVFLFSLFVLLCVIFFVVLIRRKLVRFSDAFCGQMDDMLSGDMQPRQTVEEESLFYKINYRLGRLYEVMQENKNSVAKERADLQELISDISHQVKTPIANLKMINNTLLENEVPPQKQKEFLTAQASQLDKLDFLMQAMIKTSRLETGVISLEQKQQPVYDTLAAALGGILLNAEKKQIDVQVECPEHLDARHDRKWTSEALFNILDNAVKYTPAGGQIRVSVEGWEMYVKIDIADTGIGISEQHQGTIFKRFYREDAVHDVDGIGIGLYLAREIVTLQGGYIRVASEVGKGSTFSVFLLRK